MFVNLFIEMQSGFDTKALYEIIKCYRANLLDDGKKVYIYCDCYMVQAQDIIYHSCIFGKNAEITVKQITEKEEK